MEKQASRSNGIVVGGGKQTRLHLSAIHIPQYVVFLVFVVAMLAAMLYRLGYDSAHPPKKMYLAKPTAATARAVASGYSDLANSGLQSSPNPLDKYQYYIAQAVYAQQQKQYDKALSAMTSAKQTGYQITYDYYLTLGSIYTDANRKSDAIDAYNQGLQVLTSETQLSESDKTQVRNTLQGLIAGLQ